MLNVTVSILSYNRPEYLREALLSVLSQTMPPNKICIYDNGSETRVYEHVKDLLSERVIWQGADFNRPFIWNFQRAMHGCDTRYVMMLHDDDRLCANFLQSQVELLEKNKNIIALSCNGHLIDENGERIGKTVTSTKRVESVEHFSCGGQVALKYASNSCIPFSPTIYRFDVASKVKLKEDFDKVVDAVFFCDLAEYGLIAYQTNPLYECRLHAGQDSTHFPFDLLNRLESFYGSRKCSNESEIYLLNILLQNQNAMRRLKQINIALKSRQIKKSVDLVLDPSFRIRHAVRAIWARIGERLMRNT